jgi:hypothetical protein
MNSDKAAAAPDRRRENEEGRVKSEERGRAELAGWKHAATRKSPDFRGRSNFLALVAIIN